jgi:hypothetical protein
MFRNRKKGIPGNNQKPRYNNQINCHDAAALPLVEKKSMGRLYETMKMWLGGEIEHTERRGF